MHDYYSRHYQHYILLFTGSASCSLMTASDNLHKLMSDTCSCWLPTRFGEYQGHNVGDEIFACHLDLYQEDDGK